jgi:hypothetical protein
MAAFLFWNLGQRPLQARLARMATALDVDVLILAECSIDPDSVLTALNGTGGTSYCFPECSDGKIRIFTRLPAKNLIEVFTNPRGDLSIRRLRIGPPPGLLLAAVHFPSRVNWEPNDQTLQATELAGDIRREEDRRGHRRTVLVGDLNMNPFDPGVFGSHGLHGMMARNLARRGERTVSGRSYPMFYNPMWGCFGDRTAGPPGTYYLSSSKPINYFWNIYDQVLLRPDLMDALTDLQILDSDGQEPLVTKRVGQPSQSAGSDHLPIYFRLKL